MDPFEITVEVDPGLVEHARPFRRRSRWHVAAPTGQPAESWSVTEVSGGLVVQDDAKTRASERSLSLDVLRRWKRQQAEERLAAGPAWHEHTGLVFTREDGTGQRPKRLSRTQIEAPGKETCLELSLRQ